MFGETLSFQTKAVTLCFPPPRPFPCPVSITVRSDVPSLSPNHSRQAWLRTGHSVYGRLHSSVTSLLLPTGDACEERPGPARPLSARLCGFVGSTVWDSESHSGLCLVLTSIKPWSSFMLGVLPLNYTQQPYVVSVCVMAELCYTLLCSVAD